MTNASSRSLYGYYADYTNMQQNIFNVAAVNNGGLANVPKATIEGIEASMQMQLQHFGANINAAYTHSVLASFEILSAYLDFLDGAWRR